MNNFFQKYSKCFDNFKGVSKLAIFKHYISVEARLQLKNFHFKRVHAIKYPQKMVLDNKFCLN